MAKILGGIHENKHTREHRRVTEARTSKSDASIAAAGEERKLRPSKGGNHRVGFDRTIRQDRTGATHSNHRLGTTVLSATRNLYRKKYKLNLSLYNGAASLATNSILIVFVSCW